MDLSGDDVATARESGPYDVANGTGRRSRSWRVGSYGPNTAITYALDELRRKSRDQARKNPYAGAAVDRLVTNIVGSGIVPRSAAARPVEGLGKAATKKQKAEDAAFRAQVQAKFLAWTDEADSIAAHDFYGLTALAVRGMVEGGETFTRLRTRRPEDGLTVPLQLQLLEGDHCPHLKTDAAANIRQGIQYDAIGKRVGYHLYREHPGDGIITSGSIATALVPATDVCHLYRAMRPRQARGEPWLARALRTLYDLDSYLDAELIRKKNAARLVGFVKRVLAEGSEGPLGTDPADDDGVATLDFEPGTIQVLADGEDMTFSDPKDVGPNFEMFVRESTALYNMRTLLDGVFAKGMEAIVLAPPRPNSEGADASAWLYTCRALRSAAEYIDPTSGRRAGFVDTSLLYSDAFLGTMGLTNKDCCQANLYNHPGIRECRIIGRYLARLILG